jgi:transposase
MRQFSIELKKKWVDMVRSGMTRNAVAKEEGVCYDSVRRAVAQAEEGRLNSTLSFSVPSAPASLSGIDLVLAKMQAIKDKHMSRLEELQVEAQAITDELDTIERMVGASTPALVYSTAAE